MEGLAQWLNHWMGCIHFLQRGGHRDAFCPTTTRAQVRWQPAVIDGFPVTQYPTLQKAGDIQVAGASTA